MEARARRRFRRGPFTSTLQTDVNIGMVSTSPSEYAMKLAKSTAASTELSLTNHTMTSVPVRFVIAAYDRDGKMAGINTVEKTLGASGDVRSLMWRAQRFPTLRRSATQHNGGFAQCVVQAGIRLDHTAVLLQSGETLTAGAEGRPREELL